MLQSFWVPPPASDSRRDRSSSRSRRLGAHVICRRHRLDHQAQLLLGQTAAVQPVVGGAPLAKEVALQERAGSGDVAVDVPEREHRDTGQDRWMTPETQEEARGAFVAAAVQADLAIAPRLLQKPLEQLDGVVALGRRPRLGEASEAGAGAADVDADHCDATRHEFREQIVLNDVHGLPIVDQQAERPPEDEAAVVPRLVENHRERAGVRWRKAAAHTASGARRPGPSGLAAGTR
eukprot:scaffold608_cov248-Pinguiococcus_pyrenoidosus.AAC.4